MKNILTYSFMLLLAGNAFAQSDWNLVWSLHQKPFQEPMHPSEMGIVKAGFDTDEDGWGEFLCAYTDLDSNYVLMYEASDDNTYDLVWYFKFPIQANTFTGIAVGDLDNNGVVEIITTMPAAVGPGAENPPRLWVFEWNGVQGENKYGVYTNGISEPHTSWNFDLPDNTDFRPYSLTIEDIDQDGENELIVGVRAGDRGREVLVASVIGEFKLLASWFIEYNLQRPEGGSLYSVTTGDLDNDGNREIYALVWNLFTLRIIESTGKDTYELVAEFDEAYGDEGIDYGALDGVRVADVNNDGINELYMAGTEPQNTLFMITNISDVSTITENDIQEFYHIPPRAEGRFRTLHIADPDGDGNANLMIAGERNGRIFDLEYDGDGDPADSSNWNLEIAFDIFDYSGVSDTELTPRLFYGHPANDMDQDGKNEYVFVNYSSDFEAWSGDGYVWMIEKDQITSVSVEENVLPEDIALNANYPNPFNPTTTIKYSIANAGEISLKVYNLRGEEIKTLVNSVQAAGDYTAIWNGRDNSGNTVASGVYILTLKSGTNTDSRRITLLK